MGCQLSLEKVCTVASSKKLSGDMSSALGRLGGRVLDSGVNIGVDFCAGRSARVSGRNSKMTARAALVCRKARRLRKQSEQAGRSAPRIFAAGPLAGGAYGADVQGVSDQQLLLMRRQAFSTVRPFAKSRSLTA
eukprot:3269467-Pyramimonas_sp.AAC.1